MGNFEFWEDEADALFPISLPVNVITGMHISKSMTCLYKHTQVHKYVCVFVHVERARVREKEIEAQRLTERRQMSCQRGWMPVGEGRRWGKGIGR
jgi:hypothetical protein